MEKKKINFSASAAFGSNSGEICFISHPAGTDPDYFISPSVEKLTGYKPDDIISMPERFYSIVLEEDLNIVKRNWLNLQNNHNDDSISFFYRIKTKKGEIVWLQEYLSVERDNASFEIRTANSLLLNVDILKNNEAEFIKTISSLRELNASKDKFISIISHDLRSPFTTLLGFSEILLNEPDISEDEKNEYLRYIFDSSKSQLELINCLLDWSRLQTGRIKVDPVRLNVKTIVSNAVAQLTADAVRKNIDVRIDIATDLHINADERLIGQTLLNLTSNAIKFTSEGKEIHISSGRFKEGMIEIVVRDEGLGISEENQPKLFRIDQKFSLNGTNGEKGSGLGLTLVKEIIDKHGGQVWFYSQVGEGSEFHITIPEAKNLILLVEDDHGIRALYKKIIEAALPNFEVRFADNGYEAINLYRTLLPTIVITDHDMPLMNGIQLIEAIQKKEANRTIPIIVISAKLDDEINRKYRKLGIEKIVSKPVDHNFLVQLIRDSIY
jgi:two-component system, sensor histidine kinase and response regulator